MDDLKLFKLRINHSDWDGLEADPEFECAYGSLDHAIDAMTDYLIENVCEPHPDDIRRTGFRHGPWGARYTALISQWQEADFAYQDCAASDERELYGACSEALGAIYAYVASAMRGRLSDEEFGARMAWWFDGAVVELSVCRVRISGDGWFGKGLRAYTKEQLQHLAVALDAELESR